MWTNLWTYTILPLIGAICYYFGWRAGLAVGKAEGFNSGYKFGTEENVRVYEKKIDDAYEAGKETSFSREAFKEHMARLNPGMDVAFKGEVGPSHLASKLPPLPEAFKDSGAQVFVGEKSKTLKFPLPEKDKGIGEHNND